MRITALQLLTSLGLTTSAVAYTPIYFFQLSSFNDARVCVQQCANSESNNGVNKFGCAGGAGVATCLCSDNVDQSYTMSSWFSACALSSCGDEEDASTAAQLFGDWCQANIEANEPASAAATTTTASTGSAFTASASPSPIHSATPTVTGSSTGSGDGNGSGSNSGNGNGGGECNGGSTCNIGGSGSVSLATRNKSPTYVVQGYAIAGAALITFKVLQKILNQ